MRIIGKQFIRDSRFIVWEALGRVIKTPVSLAAAREIREERQKQALARQDPHFGRFVPESSACISCSVTQLMAPAAGRSDYPQIMQAYFFEALAESQKWPEIPLAELPGIAGFSDFVKVHFVSSFEAWREYLKKMLVPQVSSHGDFYSENILMEKGQLKFIDWWQYEKVSCRYFDLINIQVFADKGRDESWFGSWLRRADNPPDKIFGVDLPKNVYGAYAVWKISRELNLLGLRGKLPLFKIKKYREIVHRLNSIILNYAD